MATFKYEGFEIINANIILQSGGSFDVTDYIQEFRCYTANGYIVPVFYVKYRVDSIFMEHFVKAHELHISLYEKHFLDKMAYTYFKAKIKMISQPISMLLRGEDKKSLRYVFIDGTGVDADMALISKQSVGGNFKQTTVENVFKQIWSQASSGSEIILLMDPFDNQIQQDIFIPKMSFIDALNYLSSTYGFYQDGLFVTTIYKDNMTYFIVSSSSKIPHHFQNLTLYLRKHIDQITSIDSGFYSAYLPKVNTDNLAMNMRANLPKEQDVIIHADDKFYKYKKLDTNQYIDIVATGSSTDIKNVLQLKNISVLSNERSFEFLTAEAIGTSIQQLYKFMNTKILEPIRLDHWQIGQLVKIKPQQADMYLFSDIIAQVFAREFILTREDDGRWHARYDVDISARGPLI